MTFSIAQIVLSAVAGLLLSGVALLAYRPRDAAHLERSLRAILAPSLLVGLSILVYRAAANTPALNDDPMPFVSPNDVLSPVVTYVALAMAETLGLPVRVDARSRALLTLVSLIVNVVTI